MTSARFTESTLQIFIAEVFARLGVPPDSAALATRSLLDASLLGIDTHGVESLEMYVTHIRSGGLRPDAELVRIQGKGGVETWDMRHGLGLAGGRRLMTQAIQHARATGIALMTCRNANHLGACGVYGKMAADEGFIGMVSQQTLASLAPWGGKEARIGASPFALVAPVEGAFPFYFDASMAAITRGRIKAHRRAGSQLPVGVALDNEGHPTIDPEKAWFGQILPIGGHKGVGLAMVFEILSCILSENRFAREIPSIVDHPDQSAGLGLFMLVIDPEAVMSRTDFAAAMKRYVDYAESSPAIDPRNPPRYAGKSEGANWLDRRTSGIPISSSALERLEEIATSLGLERPKEI